MNAHSVEQLAAELRRYIVSNPHAVDSPEGIWSIWLGRSTTSTDEIQTAIDILVSEGRLSKTSASDGTYVYRASIAHGSPSIVAVLVHGTWSRDASWTLDQSPFQRELAEQLGCRIHFRRLCWSGVNSHTHRLKAAADLRDLLADSVTRYPRASHFVVAHSHGGNVACYAMQDDRLREVVRGIICLGTPFLHVRHRPLPRNLISAMIPTLLIFAMLGVAYLLGAPRESAAKYFVAAAATSVLPLIISLVWALVRKRASRLSWRELSTLGGRTSDQAVAALAYPNLGTERLLAVRVSGDEAAGAILISQMFVWLLRRVWSFLTPIWQHSDGLRRRVTPVLGLSVAGLALAGWLAVTPSDGFPLLEAVSLVATLVLTVFGLVAILAGFMAYILLMLMLLAHLSVGLDAMLSSLDLQTTVEPSPPGEATILHVAPLKDSSLTLTGLAHSELYEHREVIRGIASWILAKRATNGCPDSLDRPADATVK